MFIHITLRFALASGLLTAFMLSDISLLPIQAQVKNQTVILPSFSAPPPKAGTAAERLSGSFKIFYPLTEQARYSILLCADLPDNNKPERVHVKSETGHVFLVFTKIENTDTLHNVFGFYPRRPASSLLFKNVKSEILNNSLREYNASVIEYLTAERFEAAISKAVALARKKYNLNKYNCYDYALELFNSLSDHDPLPAHPVRYPFIFGKGGSPCGLYKDLKRLKETGSARAPFIQIGIFRAPISTEQTAVH